AQRQGGGEEALLVTAIVACTSVLMTKNRAILQHGRDTIGQLDLTTSTLARLAQVFKDFGLKHVAANDGLGGWGLGGVGFFDHAAQTPRVLVQLVARDDAVFVGLMAFDVLDAQ